MYEEFERLRQRIGEIAEFRGDRLRAMRKSKGISADRLAMMTGITARHIFRVEQGTQTLPQGVTVGKLALALGISSDYLLGLTDDPSPCSGERLGRSPQFRGDRLRAMRKSKGVSADRLAMASGITARHIYRVETGVQSLLWGATVGKLALALGTSTDYLLNLTDDPSPCPGSKSEQILGIVLDLIREG